MKLILGRAQQTWNDYDSVNETFLCLTENAKSSAFRGHLNERSNMPTRVPAPPGILGGSDHYQVSLTLRFP